MVLAARTASFLLLFAFVAVGLLSAPYIVQGGNDEAEESNSNLVVVPDRKAMQTTENKMIGGKMVSGYYNSNMKEKSERSRKLMQEENYPATFVAFNADYKGPRHHPPKNN